MCNRATTSAITQIVERVHRIDLFSIGVKYILEK